MRIAMSSALLLVGRNSTRNLVTDPVSHSLLEAPVTGLDLQRAGTVRVGAVEIGTGSVRFVGLDVAADNSFNIAASESCTVDLQPKANDTCAVDLAVQKAVEYDRRCAHLGCEDIVTFITAPGRSWNDSVQDRFKKQIPSLRVMSAYEEAGFALFGSMLCSRETFTENSFCTLDVGRGSIQLARGKRDRNFVKLLRARTWTAGTHIARNILQSSHWDVANTSEQLRKLIRLRSFRVKSVERVMALGNCVTNLARIIHFPRMPRPKMDDIHGLELTISDIASLLKVRQVNPAKFNALVEGNGTSADRDTVLAGLLVLECICETTSIKKFTISTYGVRFGLAVRRAQKIHSA
jgi:exopolyphosphatase/pppGpp-phosphohydrolase